MREKRENERRDDIRATWRNGAAMGTKGNPSPLALRQLQHPLGASIIVGWRGEKSDSQRDKSRSQRVGYLWTLGNEHIAAIRKLIRRADDDRLRETFGSLARGGREKDHHEKISLQGKPMTRCPVRGTHAFCRWLLSKPRLADQCLHWISYERHYSEAVMVEWLKCHQLARWIIRRPNSNGPTDGQRSDTYASCPVSTGIAALKQPLLRR